MTAQKKPRPKPVDDASKAALALESIQQEAAELPADEVAVVNLDIPTAFTQAMGVIPNLVSWRPMIAKALPQHPLDTLDRLETYALAAYQAHMLWLPPENAENLVAALLTEAVPLRASLLSDAEALVQRKLLDGAAVAAIRAGHGNVDTGNDLVALGNLFSAQWSTIAGKTAATREEVKRAAELGLALLGALGKRTFTQPDGPDPLADQRRRAFTLFVRAYGQARRAISYLRWDEGDADEIIPSLYKGRNRGAARSQEEAPANAAPAAAAPANGAPANAAAAKTG
jgi:hypothetical protein